MEQKYSEKELEGKWVIILKEHILCYGDDLKKLVEEVKKEYPKERISVAKVPTKESMIY